jgi:PAS domain S-box-containing protein
LNAPNIRPASFVINRIYLLLVLAAVGSVIGLLGIPFVLRERQRGETKITLANQRLQASTIELDRLALSGFIGDTRAPSGSLAPQGAHFRESEASRVARMQSRLAEVRRLVRQDFSAEHLASTDRLERDMEILVQSPGSSVALEAFLLGTEHLRQLAGRDMKACLESGPHRLLENPAVHQFLLILTLAAVLGAGIQVLRSSRRAIALVHEAVVKSAENAQALKAERDFAASLTSIIPAIVIILDPQGAIQHVNPFFEKLTGWRLDEIKGHDWFSLVIPAQDRDRIRALFDKATDNEPTRGYISPIITRSGESRDIEWHDQTIQGAAGRVTSLLAIGIDVTQRQRAEIAVRNSEARLKEAQRLARIGNWELDHRSGHLHWSEEVFRLFEIDHTRFEGTYEAFLGAIHPQDREGVNHAYLASLTNRQPYRIQHRLLMPDGRVKHVEEKCETNFAPDGTPLLSRGTVQDITSSVLTEQALLASLREKTTLLQEIHHRVKNNLQIISSLLYFEGKKLNDDRTIVAFDEVRNRLRAMMLVHEKLYRSRDLTQVDFSDYIRSLVPELMSSSRQAGRNTHFTVETATLALPIETALPCGLILTELLTNVGKYAFPDGRAGKVLVQLTLSPDRFNLTVSDDGVGLPPGFDPDTASSFGWQLIRQLAGQIAATLTIERGRGTRVTLSVLTPATKPASPNAPAH